MGFISILGSINISENNAGIVSVNDESNMKYLIVSLSILSTLVTSVLSGEVGKIIN